MKCRLTIPSLETQMTKSRDGPQLRHVILSVFALLAPVFEVIEDGDHVFDALIQNLQIRR